MKIDKDKLQDYALALSLGQMGVFDDGEAMEICTNDEEIMEAAASVISSEQYRESVESDPSLLILVGLVAQDMCEYLIKKQEERKNGGNE